MDERVTMRFSTDEIQGTWECPVAAVDDWREFGWIPVSEWVEPTESAEPSAARKSRKDVD